MKIKLSKDEIALLTNRNIPFAATKDYDDDEALEFLDKVREAQVSYAQNEDDEGKELYSRFERIADKIYKTIPN